MNGYLDVLRLEVDIWVSTGAASVAELLAIAAPPLYAQHARHLERA
jgi:hypothetical protein